jgi:hypothetical protein
MLSVGQDGKLLRVCFLTAGGHHDTTKARPALKDSETILLPPENEAVLGLCFSANGVLLAVRQLSRTTIVRPVYWANETQGDETPVASIRLDRIVALTRQRTGSHLHADIAFHPRNQNFVGVVDAHGNWSAWRMQGRSSKSSRVLYKTDLFGFGKLIPSTPNLRQMDNSPYFDGWHRICCLKRPMDVDLLLVSSRRAARTFSLNGEAITEVDMRLGPPASRQWILDIQTSQYRPAVCYVLTSTRLQILSLSDDGRRRGELDLVCSWAHYWGRGDPSLKLLLIETSHGMDEAKQAQIPC